MIPQMAHPMNVLTLRVNTWLEARVLADELSSGWIFRGQRDASWPLITALQRAGQQGQENNFLLPQIEQQITETFQRRAHHFLSDAPPLKNLIEWLALIQHFGGPTRQQARCARKRLPPCANWELIFRGNGQSTLMNLTGNRSITFLPSATMPAKPARCSSARRKSCIRGPTIIGTKTYAKRFHVGEDPLGRPVFVAVEDLL